MLQIFYRCRDNLSFFRKKSFSNVLIFLIKIQDFKEIVDESTGDNASPLRNNFDYQIFDDINPHLNSNDLDVEYYDNNYWNGQFREFDFEII